MLADKGKKKDVDEEDVKENNAKETKGTIPPVTKKKGKKGKGNKNDDWSDNDDDVSLKLSDAEEEVVAPVKKNKKQSKSQKTAEKDADEKLSEEEDDGKKKTKENEKHKNRFQLESDDEYISEDENDMEIGKSKNKKVQKSKVLEVEQGAFEGEQSAKPLGKDEEQGNKIKPSKKDDKSKSKTKVEAKSEPAEDDLIKNGKAADVIVHKVADLDINDAEAKGDNLEKKLTHKEKKKLKKQQEYEKQMETMLKKGGQGHSELDSNFTVSQTQRTAGQLAALENAVDIKVENFSISAKGKDLFVNANLLIANGRHYGLVGPNGYGKTTLLRHLAQRAFPIPPNIDILYCEQEVVADDYTAVETVLQADTKRTELLAECKKLEEEFNKGKLDVQDRLNEVYAELKAIGADSAEPRARRILAGLGFTKEMQVISKHFLKLGLCRLYDF